MRPMGGQNARRFGQMARGCFVRRRLGRRRLLPMLRKQATERRRMHLAPLRRVRLGLPSRVHYVDNATPGGTQGSLCIRVSCTSPVDTRA